MDNPWPSALEVLLNEFVGNKCSFEEFATRYTQLFVEEVPDGALTPVQVDYYGEINEKAAWTTSAPSPEEIAVGWLSDAMFRAWLLEWRATRYP